MDRIRNFRSPAGLVVPSGTIRDGCLYRSGHLGERGVWHRVQWGGFVDRGSAARLCQSLRGVGLECFVWQARGSG